VSGRRRGLTVSRRQSPHLRERPRSLRPRPSFRTARFSKVVEWAPLGAKLTQVRSLSEGDAQQEPGDRHDATSEGRQSGRMGDREAGLPEGVTAADWGLERVRVQNPSIRSYLGCIRLLEEVLDSNYAILHCSPSAC